MGWPRFFWHAALVATLLPRPTLPQDTTPPTVSVIAVAPYIFHFLVTVTVDEVSNVWCGAVLTGATAPSAANFKGSSSPIVGVGTASSVAAATVTTLAVASLSPGTAYDVYCYAEDAALNPTPPSSISATKQTNVVTLSGGDYIRPVFSYVSPFQLIEPQSIKLFVQLNEEGTVWCVLKKDTGSGTTTPTSGEIMGNVNVDSWATALIRATFSYQAQMLFLNLPANTTYDAYCFAKDLAGNGIDNTPGYTQDTTAIPNTKRSGLSTPTTTSSSALQLQGGLGSSGAGVTSYTLQPAVWNNFLPRKIISADQERRDIESWNTPLALSGALLVNFARDTSRGCGSLRVAPPGLIWMAVVVRGGCTFREKAKRAYFAGYSGLLVVNFSGTTLPDMIAPNADDLVEIPSWIVSITDGSAIISAMENSDTPISITVADLTRKPILGEAQSDTYGLRMYRTQ